LYLDNTPNARSVGCVSQAAKKPLAVHAVELPVFATERSMCHLCVRFFDEAVREVGNAIISIPVSSTVQDVLTEAATHLRPEWGISGQLRCLEVIDGRLHKIHRPESSVRSLACFGKSNMLFHSLRVEADPESGRISDGHKLIEILHTDRHTQTAFGQPVLLAAGPGEKVVSLKNRCKEKLRVPDQERKFWRLVRTGTRLGRQHLKDDEPWDADPSPDGKLCLEHVHPNPASRVSTQSRYNKALHIK